MLDPNYQVDGLSRSIKAKITQLMKASHNAAFSGSAHPDDRADIEHAEKWARYCLERAIKTEIEKASKG